jgi:hypothetical protein
MASIEIQGLDALFRKLDRIEDVQNTLMPPMQRAVLRLQRDMADYPPKRAGSSYVRTGTLGRRWTTKVDRTSDGLQGKIGNNTAYGPFVQSKRFQASVHRGRWQTDAQVAERNERDIVADFNATIQRKLDE